MKKIVIFGGSGLLGSEIISTLSRSNYLFWAPNSKKVNLLNEIQIQDYLNSVKPDWIINCAAWTKVDLAESYQTETLKINYFGVRNLCKVLSRYSTRLIHISTDYVFDGNSSSAYFEDSQVNPINYYGESKLLGELCVNHFLPNQSYILRTSWLYGKQGKNFVKSIISKAKNSQNVQVVDDQIGSPTNARDLSEAILNLMENSPVNGTYHYVNSGSCSWFQFALEIYTLLGVDNSLVLPISTSTANLLADRPKFSVLNTLKWETAKISPIIDWQESLSKIVPEILQAIKEPEY